MVCGVSTIADKPESLFSCLVTIIDVTKYDWFIDDVDLNYLPFSEGLYKGAKFRECFANLCTLSFFRIRGYPTNTIIGSIDTYDEYLKSKCKILVLYYDGGFIELYIKDMKLENIYNALCSNTKAGNTAYIEKNDRTYMHF